MEPIKIFFFALASFFGVDNQRILADKTTVTVYPHQKQIIILQENIFAYVSTEKDLSLAQQEWSNVYHYEKNGTKWSEDLVYFPDKKIEFSTSKKGKTAKITLTYTHPNDMAVMGIWYNDSDNQFVINDVPEHHLKTKDGKKRDIFWYFDGDKNFSFTVQPFRIIPKSKKTASILLNQ